MHMQSTGSWLVLVLTIHVLVLVAPEIDAVGTSDAEARTSAATQFDDKSFSGPPPPYLYTPGSGSTLHGVALEDGALTWNNIARSANFSVARRLVDPVSASALVELVNTMELDMDPDSVDGEPTFEFYLEQAGSFELLSNVPMKPDAEPDTAKVSDDINGMPSYVRRLKCVLEWT
jgi:hypothetical protein